MLDTNVASYIIKGNFPAVRKRLSALPPPNPVGAEVAVSTVTEAELLYGLAKRGHPASLSIVIREFLLRVNVLPWDSAAAKAYGDLRAACEAAGRPLGAHDIVIAAHAKASDAILVTRDKSFKTRSSRSEVGKTGRREGREPAIQANPDRAYDCTGQGRSTTIDMPHCTVVLCILFDTLSASDG